MIKLAIIAVLLKNIATYNKDYVRIVIAYANSALQHLTTVLNALIQHTCKKISACLIASKATIRIFKNKNASSANRSVFSARVKNNVQAVKRVIIF